ncbi:hypothetical protein ES319_D09G150700v1 [Gossypium barbadense]|uniref:Uncharacterized protein n=1 Tax=Gossypium barbadense TaxID=3634 RepID=A0A5J5Q5P3_GOSBA|nr:hypothetical protein ES319_D09G150700v1 [Gossypium barbadense]KAB2013350.1 hypothetical protein ES319_D09G150700v1 [Gossypium barbadense]
MVVLLPLVGCQWQESRYAWFGGAEYWKLIGIFSSRQFQHELAERMEIQKLRCHLVNLLGLSQRVLCSRGWDWPDVVINHPMRGKVVLQFAKELCR